MSRNTIRRVEVAAPIEDEKLRKRIREMFRILMKDNVKARVMLSDGTYIHDRRREHKPLISSQEYFYDEAYSKLEVKKNRQEQMKKNRESGTVKKKTPSAKRTSSSAKKPAAKSTRKRKTNKSQ